MAPDVAAVPAEACCNLVAGGAQIGSVAAHAFVEPILFASVAAVACYAAAGVVADSNHCAVVVATLLVGPFPFGVAAVDSAENYHYAVVAEQVPDAHHYCVAPVGSCADH